MDLFVIPGLLPKLHLLARHGGAGDLGSLAARLGLSEHGLRGWTKEVGAKAAGTIPARQRDALVALFQESLPDLSSAAVESLLLGTVDDLAAAYAARSRPDLLVYLDAHANFGRARVVTQSGIALIEEAGQRGEAQYELRLGQMFRIEFEASRTFDHLFGLQIASQASGQVSIRRGETRRLHMPAGDEEKPYGYMQEKVDASVSTFAAIMTRFPVPLGAASAAPRTAPLTSAELTTLGAHLGGMPKEDRGLYAVRIVFKDC
ncbi:MAG: hypothetical protein AAGF33_05375 [Pseudomonadota bacterium]